MLMGILYTAAELRGIYPEKTIKGSKKSFYPNLQMAPQDLANLSNCSLYTMYNLKV
jgi:hypothetical protein